MRRRNSLDNLNLSLEDAQKRKNDVIQTRSRTARTRSQDRRVDREAQRPVHFKAKPRHVAAHLDAPDDNTPKRETKKKVRGFEEARRLRPDSFDSAIEREQRR